MLLLQCEGGSKKTFRFLPFEFDFLLLRRFDFRLPPPSPRFKKRKTDRLDFRRRAKEEAQKIGKGGEAVR